MLPKKDTRHGQHLSGCAHGVGVLVLVGQIYDLGNAALYDHLGALVAGEKAHVYCAALYICAILVEDGIHLRVAHVRVLGVEL
jgi:hypothetical protein